MDSPMARLINPRSQFSPITVIRDRDGPSHKTPQAIRDAFTKYYTALYDHSPDHTHTNRVLMQEIDSYLTRASLPRLPESRMETLIEAITEEEIGKALGYMKPHKAPGPDGFTYHFYKSFAAELIPRLLLTFNDMLTGGIPPAESLMASIVLLPKPGRDPQLVENYRPISLINTDLKLFTKILSLRLDRLLGSLIHPDQVGFIPNRQAFENTRKTADLIWYASAHKVPSLFISLDAEKAFDRAEWPFLFSLLEHLGFPSAYVAAVQALYSSPSAQVVIPGTDRIPFNIRNGTRQGCPLSPALFALFLEPLLQHIRLDSSIRGILIQGNEYKVSAYADDVLLSVSQPLSSLPNVLRILSDFARLSGYKINMDKSEAIPIH
uniref:Reverse transcriptase domain-containing protein n=1 Tax=Leptobrachium leishanense TaxID=445787 RepID=A0A8C5QLK7_9ANUR